LCGALASNMTRRERAFWRAVGCGLPGHLTKCKLQIRVAWHMNSS
jgi:hypothetical protein